MMSPPVAIIILNWNNPADTLECLESVFRLEYDNYRVIVVDNGSTDDSVSQFLARHPDLEVLETGVNLGYAGGNNAGILKELGRDSSLFLLLNNDALLDRSALQLMVTTITSEPRCGMVNPLIINVHNPEAVWATGVSIDIRDYTTARASADYAVSSVTQKPPFDVDIAAGTVLLVTRSMIETVGLMDEDYFLYYEDVDWSLRAVAAGFRIVAVPAAVAWHRVSATLGPDSPAVEYYMVRNRLRLAWKFAVGFKRPAALQRIIFQEVRTVAAFSFRRPGTFDYRSPRARVRAISDFIQGRWGPAPQLD